MRFTSFRRQAGLDSGRYKSPCQAGTAISPFAWVSFSAEPNVALRPPARVSIQATKALNPKP